jgi:hypothetical protein
MFSIIKIKLDANPKFLLIGSETILTISLPVSEQTFVHLITFSSVEDPGSGAFLTPGSGIRHGKNPIRGEHPRSFFRESLETVFLVKKYLLYGSGSGIFLTLDPV